MIILLILKISKSFSSENINISKDSYKKVLNNNNSNILNQKLAEIRYKNLIKL